MAKKKKSLKRNIYETIFLLLVVFGIRTYGFGLYQVPTGSMETTMLVGERFFADKFTYNFIRDPKVNDIITFNQPPAYYQYSNNPIINTWQRYVYGPQNWTKRVIGQPGDAITGAIENGKPVIYRNGKKLNESYLNQYPIVYVNQYGNGLNPKTIDPSKPYNNQPFYRINPSQIASPFIYPEIPAYSKTPINKTGNHWDGSDEFHIKLGNDEYWLMGDNRKGSGDSRMFGPVKKQLIHGRVLFRIWSIDSDESWWIFDLLKHPIDFWNRVRFNRCLQTIQ